MPHPASLIKGRFARVLLPALLPALLAACASTGPLTPFTTDGCSLFPDGSLISNTSWCQCCVTHDLVYWRGGTAKDRLLADQELKACVQKAADNPVVAQAMYAGVRLGGGPYLYTPFRWGYGWPYPRSYKPLTQEEAAAVALEEQAYLAKPLPLSCPSNASSDE
jgi:hypothetical protein